MHAPKKRHTMVAALVLAFAALPATAGLSPAHAGTYCQDYAGPTPSVEVDTNDDGNPEVRVPSLSDVSVCATSDVFVHGEQLRVEPCNEWFEANCWRIYVHAHAGVTVHDALELCRSVDGTRTCSRVDVGPWTYWTPYVDRICIGIDLDGEHPCSGGQIIGFE